MFHSMVILYFRLPYFHDSKSAVFSTQYFSTLISHRRSLDSFYSGCNNRNSMYKIFELSTVARRLENFFFTEETFWLPKWGSGCWLVGPVISDCCSTDNADRKETSAFANIEKQTTMFNWHINTDHFICAALARNLRTDNPFLSNNRSIPQWTFTATAPRVCTRDPSLGTLERKL